MPPINWDRNLIWREIGPLEQGQKPNTHPTIKDVYVAGERQVPDWATQQDLGFPSRKEPLLDTWREWRNTPRPVFDEPLTPDELNDFQRRPMPLQRSEGFTPAPPDAPKPPLPQAPPVASPVDVDQVRLAARANLSPEGRQLWYNSPVNVRYMEPDPNIKAWASYDLVTPIAQVAGDLGLRQVNSSMNFLSAPAAQDVEAMRHELAHKYYYEQMPPAMRREWQANYVEDVPTPILEGLTGSQLYGPQMAAQTAAQRMVYGDIPSSEGYAYMTAPPFWNELPDVTKRRYYAGLFNDTGPSWDEWTGR